MMDNYVLYHNLIKERNKKKRQGIYPVVITMAIWKIIHLQMTRSNSSFECGISHVSLPEDQIHSYPLISHNIP